MSKHAAQFLVAILFLVPALGTVEQATAGRAVTPDEQVKLVAALQAEGCSSGKIEFDDGKFEIDDARCSDGKTYDLDFDASFKLISKKLED